MDSNSSNLADRKIPADRFALIIGAMKCGTTSLFEYLSGHPEICPAFAKEPEYFSRNQRHRVSLQNYEDLWQFDAKVHKYALEASTGYTKFPQEPDVARRIFEYGIKPKFIYVIRNPIERIESHFNFAIKRNAPWHLTIQSKQPINLCNYYLQLQQYRKYFPSQEILLLDFEELKENPKSVLLKINRFLDISTSWFPAEYDVKNRTTLESKVVRRIRSARLQSASVIVPQWFRNRGLAVLQSLFPPPKKRFLSEQEKCIVHALLNDDMRKLHDEYGFDVEKWGFR